MVKVKPDILIWARETAGLERDDPLWEKIYAPDSPLDSRESDNAERNFATLTEGKGNDSSAASARSNARHSLH